MDTRVVCMLITIGIPGVYALYFFKVREPF